MSGGSYNYLYCTLSQECAGRMYDAEMNGLIVDLCNVLHELEWWQSCDSSEEVYRKAVAKFKKKWFNKGYKEPSESDVTVKLVIEIPKETKQAFDKAESNDLKGGFYDHGGVIGKAIQNGTPLDGNSDRAEARAYFLGQTYGWEQGRKALIKEAKVEMVEEIGDVGNGAYSDGLYKALEILNNIGKENTDAN